jgi:saccharopine dehydrogenase-like NADP-dependent oxidoreductase
MKQAYIAGLGLQGAAIAYGMHRLGYKVSGIDIIAENIDAARKVLGKLGVEIDAVAGDFRTHFPSDSPDIVISALPFNHNLDLAEMCIEKGLRYCDLGGNIETSRKINALADAKAKVPVMTDLGLAPGIANIIAELLYRRIDNANSVRIRVGGLPVHPIGTLKYGLTFSAQGLFNEYRDICYVIRAGKKLAVEPLIDIDLVPFDEIGTMEAFNTSGGIANTLETMLARGVTFCDYKTIRFPGHVALIRFMLFECKMSKEAFTEAVINACGFIREDQVLISIEVSRLDNGHAETVKCRVLHDENFTAMQKTTGFGAAAVAAIMGTGLFDGKTSLKYEDVPTGEFTENLSRLIPEIAL